MMKTIHEGLTILLRYDPEGDFSAEHDEVYAGGGHPDEMEPDDVAKLLELGWRWDESMDSWVCFT